MMKWKKILRSNSSNFTAIFCIEFNVLQIGPSFNKNF